MRSEAERRHHRQRVIRNRLKAVLNTWHDYRDGPYTRHPGLLDKDHLANCSCIVCGGEHYREHRHEHEAAWRRRQLDDGPEPDGGWDDPWPVYPGEEYWAWLETHGRPLVTRVWDVPEFVDVLKRAA